MAGLPVVALDPRARRRLITAAIVRAFLTTAALVAAYYIIPFDRDGRLSGGVRIFVAAALFVIVMMWQIRAILISRVPGLRAIVALSMTVPLFLLLFAATYFVMSSSDPTNFSQEHLTRTDSLYFAVTVFATVGFGDITATSETARAVVTSQMILDLLVISLGIQAFVHAARFGRQRQAGQVDPP
jgi:voltage-gated potassium channel